MCAAAQRAALNQGLHWHTSLPNASGQKTGEIEIKFTHSISSSRDEVSTVQPSGPRHVVFGGPGFWVLFFSKKRRETHCWFVYGGRTATDGLSSDARNVTRSLPILGKGSGLLD